MWPHHICPSSSWCCWLSDPPASAPPGWPPPPSSSPGYWWRSTSASVVSWPGRSDYREVELVISGLTFLIVFLLESVRLLPGGLRLLCWRSGVMSGLFQYQESVWSLTFLKLRFSTSMLKALLGKKEGRLLAASVQSTFSGGRSTDTDCPGSDGTGLGFFGS